MHRDFKPRNVLVVEEGGRLRAKVGDFGLARTPGSSSGSDCPEAATRDDLPSFSGRSALDETLTAAGEILGTPPYMAPEQFVVGEVDARVDQYAVCVALWEGLTGELPFRGDRPAVLAAKRSRPPSWPLRSPVPTRVTRAIRRGMSPDPRDRFASVQDLVDALDPSPKRGKIWIFGVGALSALAAVGFTRSRLTAQERAVTCDAEAQTIASTWNDESRGNVRRGLESAEGSMAPEVARRVITRLDGYAETWSQARHRACEAAFEEDTTTLRVQTCFEDRHAALAGLVEALGAGHPESARRAITAAAGLPRIEPCEDPSYLRRQPVVSDDPAIRRTRREARQALDRARALMRLGATQPALAAGREALARAESIDDVALAVRSETEIGKLLGGTGELEEAGRSLERAYLRASRAQDDVGAADAASAALYVIGHVAARPQEGRLWSKLAEVALDRTGDIESERAAEWLDGLASLEFSDSRYVEARDAARRALELRQRLQASDTPDYATALMNLAVAEFSLGRYDEALERHEEALALRRRLFGSSHPEVAFSLHQIGTVEAARGNHERAAEAYAEALAMREATLGLDHPKVAETLNNMAVLASDRGRLDEAGGYYERALAILERSLGEAHPNVAQVLANLGTLFDERGQPARGRPLLERALRLRRDAFGERHRAVAQSQHALAIALDHLGELDEALALHHQAVASYEEILGVDHPEYALAVEAMNDTLAQRPSE